MVHRAQVLQDRLIEFAVEVSRLTSRLPASPLGVHLARQLLRCGTSPAPNYAEAQAAESRQDFIHKMRICLKELRETRVWLLLVNRLDMRPETDVDGLTRESGELIAIFTQSVLTATKRARTPSV